MSPKISPAIKRKANCVTITHCENYLCYSLVLDCAFLTTHNKIEALEKSSYSNVTEIRLIKEKS